MTRGDHAGLGVSHLNVARAEFMDGGPGKARKLAAAKVLRGATLYLRQAGNRRVPMQLLLDGGGMLFEHWRSLFVLMGSILGFGGLGVSLFPGATRDRTWIAFPLSLGTGAILLTLLSFILFLASLVRRDVLEPGAYGILAAGGILLVLALRRRETRLAAAWGLLGLLLLLLVRLAFVSKLVLPPYSDSPTHYLVVLNLLEPSSRSDALYLFEDIFQNYYHFGVHCLTAWVALVSGETSPVLLAVIGQVFLTIHAFSVFALARILAANSLPGARNSAEWAAGLIAAFGFWMPAFGVNWGKYPTVAGLAVLPIPLVYLYAARGTRPKSPYWILTGLLFVGAVLLQSRTGLLMGLALVSHFISRLVRPRLSSVSFAPITVGVVLVAGLMYWGWLRPDLTAFYISNWPLLVAIVVLLPSAYCAYPEQTLTTLLTLAGMAGLSLMEAGPLLRGRTFQLLDPPFLQMGLYLPLAVLGGLGAAGLGAKLPGTRKLSKLPIALLGLLVLVEAQSIRTFYPDQCCDYASQDDLRAFEWLTQNASSEALIVTAGLRTSTRILEQDAGSWVYAMTGLPTAKRSFNSTPYDPEFLGSICPGRKEVYLYIGGGPMGFQLSDIVGDARNYEVVFSSGHTALARVKACLR